MQIFFHVLDLGTTKKLHWKDWVDGLPNW